MTHNSRKLTAKQKNIIERDRKLAAREADTIYWLQFVPKEGSVVSRDDLESKWKILLPGNPSLSHEYIEKAEVSFAFGSKSENWRDVAESHSVVTKYNP